MDEKPKSSPPTLKQHGDELLDTVRKIDQSGEEDDTSLKREGQQQDGTEAPREPAS
jgi:hypothetical protein